VQFQDQSDTLKRSSWPRCDQLAADLAQHGKAAIAALEESLKSKTHHVRSACLRAINTIDPSYAKPLAEIYLKDRAYEVRETAANILGVPTP
jgi:HEAT repeat protein